MSINHALANRRILCKYEEIVQYVWLNKIKFYKNNLSARARVLLVLLIFRFYNLEIFRVNNLEYLNHVTNMINLSCYLGYILGCIFDHCYAIFKIYVIFRARKRDRERERDRERDCFKGKCVDSVIK